jgi:hypothetical protein
MIEEKLIAVKMSFILNLAIKVQDDNFVEENENDRVILCTENNTKLLEVKEISQI